MSTAARWPADRVERWSIERLIPYARNARTHSPAQVAQIAASIHRFGWTNPVLVDEDGTIIAGHGRVLAAQQLAVTDVPVMVAAGWSEAQIRAFRIADNKLPENAGWDMALLSGEIKTLDLEHLALLGFSEQELDRIIAWEPAFQGLTDPDEAPPLGEHAVSAAGDVWVLGRHRLMCGDATDALNVRQLLAGVGPTLMVTDPPYGVDYDPAWRARAGVNNNPDKLGRVANDDRVDWREAWALFPGEVAYVWHAGKFAGEVQRSLEACEFQIRSQIIWAKDRFALSRGHYHWQHEPCWYAVRGTGHWVGDRSQSTLWQIKTREDSGLGHGTQKPVECMRRPMLNNSSAGQAIYEPFSGSGTTIIAAEETGRTCYAMELNPLYVDVAVKRWQAFTGKAATRETGGHTFNELTDARPQA